LSDSEYSREKVVTCTLEGTRDELELYPPESKPYRTTGSLMLTVTVCGRVGALSLHQQEMSYGLS
jgi:hypothetical protein